MRADIAAERIERVGVLAILRGGFAGDHLLRLAHTEGIKTGTVNVNDSATYWELHVPFGGASGKSSGVGRVGGMWALRDMSDLKTISIDVG